MLRARRAWTVRYGIAALAVTLVLLIEALLDPLIQGESPFLLLSAAVLVGAVFGGLGPGVFATLLGTVIGDYFLLSPVGTFVPPDVAHGLRTGLFLVQGLIISVIGAELTSARRRAESNARRAQEDRESLRESEERLRLATDSAELGIWDYDPVTGQTSWDARTREMFGLSQEAAVSYETFLARIHPDDREWVEQVVQRALNPESEGHYDIEYRAVGIDDGAERWVSSRGRAFFDHTGRAVRFTGMVRDITGRKRAEDTQRFLAEASTTLSSSLDYRTTLSEVARLAVPTLADWCAVDVLEDGSISRLAVVHQNPEKVELAHELQRRYPPDPDAPQGVPAVLRSGNSEFYPEVTDEILVAVARNEGHLRLMREVGFTSAMVVPMTARGRTLGAITLVSAESGRRYGEADLKLVEELARRAALAVDNARLYQEAQKEIAERKRTEQALRISEERYRAVIEQAGEGIFLFDVETKCILETNTALQHMLDYTSEELLEMRVYDLVPDDPESVDRNVERTQEEGHLLVGERSYRRRDGSLVDLEVSGSVISYGGKEVVCSVVRDITERRKTERALREVREAERNRMARDLHDGALQDISYAMAEAEIVRLLSEDPALSDRAERLLEALQRGGRELRGAVLDLRLGEEPDQPFSRQLESLVNQNRKMAPELDISLAVEGDLSSFGLAGTELLRTLQEALTNVRRHAQARSARVTVRVEDGVLVAGVSDDGRGFEPDTAPGVGFRSMRERIAALDGNLEVESQPGDGTRVCLRVPVSTLLGEVTNPETPSNSNGDVGNY